MSPGDPAAPRNAEALSLLLRELAAVPPPAEDRWEEVLPAGAVIGRFEIQRELGRGGFGVVYEALDRELGRQVAFKAVNPGTDAGGREQLLREAETIARLQHPNLVTLFDAGRCDRGPYLVLELLRGRTLKDRLGAGPLPVDEALGIAADVARGLAHAHAAGVVHRDLKPSNVFLTEAGTAKLLDFGLSHAFGRKGASGGTPAFMAPEQWQEGAEDARTDLFALGALLHRMVSGTLPFGNDGRSISEGRPAPPLAVPEAPALGALVGRLLALDPAGRPGSAEEVLARLEAIRAARREAGRRRRTWARWGAALAAAAVIGAAGAAWLVRRPLPRDPSRPRSVAILPFANLSDGPDDRFFAEGVHGELITQLARVSGLLVIARGSVQQYAPGARNLEAIAGELGVDAVLEGTVQHAGSRTRVTARLSDPRSGAQLWADRFDRDTADLFAVQAEVALEIAGALGATLTPRERETLHRSPTTDREAHDLFLRGLYYWERSSGVESDNRTALELFEKAAARDPRFAIAHAWVSIVRAEWSGDCDGARAALARGAAADPEAAEVHAARGRVQELCDNDLRGAIAQYEEALRDRPGDAGVRAYRGSARITAGDYDGGLEDLRRAFALAPRSYLAAVDLTQELLAVRRFDEAARTCARAREIEPGDVHALLLCALIPTWRDGSLAEVRRALESLPRELPSSGTGAWSLFRSLSLAPDLALAFAREGRLPDPFSTRPFIPRAYLLGAAHHDLGEEPAAREAFAEALAALEARAAKEAKPGRQLRLYLARARAGAGQVDRGLAEARAILEEAREPERRVIALGFVAEIAAAGGRVDEAVGALRELLEVRGGLATRASIRAAPRFAALRGQPAFDALVAEPLAARAAATPPAPRP